MTPLWILAALIIVVGVIVLGLVRAYRNPKQPHRITPSEKGIPFEEVRFPTRNGRRLYGWWIPAGAGASAPLPTLILVHGWGRNLERMLPYIEELHPTGFNLLAFDSRSHGSSDPDGYSSMIKFAEDIRAAVDFAQRQEGVDGAPVGIIGVSLGGAAAIFAAAEDERIAAVVTIGAFAHPADIMRMELQRKHIPYFPVVWLLFKYVQLRIGASFERIAPVNNIGNTHAKFLLIHGREDRRVPVAHATRLQDAARPRSTELWIVEGSGHSDCHHHPEFWQRVRTFLGTAPL